MTDSLPWESLVKDWVDENRDWGIDLTPAMAENFRLYLELLIDARRTINLIGIEEPREVLTQLFRDALCLQKTGGFSAEGPLLDLGTGGGIPGIPLKITNPSLHLWLLEARSKKAAFLRRTAERIGLSQVEILEGRAETLAHAQEYRERAAVVVSRSVAALPELVELGLPFLALGGLLVTWKGSRWSEELESAGRAIELLGGEFEQSLTLEVPGCEYPRVLVMIRKHSPTPDAFPRRNGVPHRKPL